LAADNMVAADVRRRIATDSPPDLGGYDFGASAIYL